MRVGCEQSGIPVTTETTPAEAAGVLADAGQTAAALASDEDDEWKVLWDARLAALEKLLGKSEENILTSMMPVYLGGAADVVTFADHVEGFAYVTAGLVGSDGQKATDLGEYELMICSREANSWMPSLVSRLSSYTMQTALKAGDTMNIGPAMPADSTIAALLFVPYAEIQVLERDAGVLLCIGITQAELNHCRVNGPTQMLEKLKSDGIFPFTDPQRDSVEL